MTIGQIATGLQNFEHLAIVDGQLTTMTKGTKILYMIAQFISHGNFFQNINFQTMDINNALVQLKPRIHTLESHNQIFALAFVITNRGCMAQTEMSDIMKRSARSQRRMTITRHARFETEEQREKRVDEFVFKMATFTA